MDANSDTEDNVQTNRGKCVLSQGTIQYKKWHRKMECDKVFSFIEED